MRSEDRASGEIAMRLGPIVLSILIAASAGAARADDDRRAFAPAEPVSIQNHDPAAHNPADRVQSLPAPRQGAGRAQESRTLAIRCARSAAESTCRASA